MLSVIINLDEEMEGKLNDLVREFGVNQEDILTSCLEIVYQNIYTLKEPVSKKTY